MAMQLIRLGQDWRNLKAGRVVRLAGAPPPDLQTYEPCTGPAGDNVPVIDHVRDVAWQQRLRESETRRVEAPPPMVRADIQKRFLWTEAQFEDAQAAGFPKAAGFRLKGGMLSFGGGQEPYWHAHDLDKWEASLGALGFTRATKTR